jgi:GrpB-like predicted nucleotidyltransferase (UPF0157 family)
MQDKYVEVFNKIQQDLVEILKDFDVEYDIQHVGGSSIPGVITKGDIDICILTNTESINLISSTLLQSILKHHPELWTDDFNLFHTEKYGYPTDIIVVVRGTTRDSFVLFRDTLRNDKKLVDEYNIIKKNILGTDKQTQRDAKIPFIKKVIQGHGYWLYE